MSKIKGIDLVTEGLLTLQKVIVIRGVKETDCAIIVSSKRRMGQQNCFGLLFAEATEINFFFGNALNENYTALHIEREKKKKLALQLLMHWRRKERK